MLHDETRRQARTDGLALIDFLQRAATTMLPEAIALTGAAGQANYAAAKAGVIGFTKTVAKEVARFGITVNAVSPNAETPMVAAIPPEKKAELTAAVPLGRFGDPGYQDAFRDFLRSKYKGQRFDLLMAVQDTAVDFVNHRRDELFPETPMVLNHTGFPWDRSPAGLRAWREAMRTIFRRKSTVCLVSSSTQRRKACAYPSV